MMLADATVTWADREFASRTEALAHLDSWIMALERRPPNAEMLALIEFLWVCRSDLIVAGPRP
jgi:hypothetical protein